MTLPPADPPTPIRVVACVIRRGATLLLCLRPGHKRHGGLWEFPGGKIEPGESDLDAARRELHEELGVRVLGAGAVEFSVLDPGSDFQIDFVPVWIDGEPQCIEHPRVEWTGDDALLTLPLAPSDRRYAEHRLAGGDAAGPAGSAAGEHDERARLEVWGRIWGVPDLADVTTVAFSTRLRRSLGRCRPASGRITLHAALKCDEEDLLAEVLCHEAAHVAAHRLSAGEARPHGVLWRQLVRAAGFEPHTRRQGWPAGVTGHVPGQATARAATGRYTVEHRCPVCHTVRYARRAVPAWRCAECQDNGLPGELVIRRAPSTGGPDD
jgi:8-oxo-dGTP pyrophosphatase MutT (NUDIX family)/predicted SprT family Zn-dependent metalloprotease